MKTQLINILLLVLLSSCLSPNSQNFHKRKYLDLKSKQVFGIESSTKKKKYSPNDATAVESLNISEKTSTPSDMLIEQSADQNKKVKASAVATQKTIVQSSTTSTTDNKQSSHASKKKSTSKRNEAQNQKNEVKQQKRSGLYYYVLLGFVPLLSFGKKRSQKISKWASINVKPARLLIAALTATGIGSSFLLGNMLQLRMSDAILISPVLIGAAAYAISKHKVSKNRKHLKNKISFSMFGIASFFATFSMGSSITKLNAIAAIEDPTIVEPAVAVLLTVLIVMVLLMAVYGITILACSLVCSGFAGLGLFVFFGGIFTLSFLAVLAIMELFRKESQRDERFAKDAALVALLITILPVVIPLITNFLF